MKLGRGYALAVAVVVLVLVAPSASAMLIQGHSPIVLLVKDPNGNEIGCLGSNATGCTSTSSSDYMDNMPASENASYSFPGSPVCETIDCPLVTITNPTPGTWTVYYYSTLTGHETGTTYITVDECSNSTSTPSCPIDLIGSPSHPVWIGAGSSGHATFLFPPTGTVGVPEFPYGMLLLIALVLPALLIYTRFQRGGRAKTQ